MLLAVVTGWSAPAFAPSMTGACPAAMGSTMPMTPDEPTASDDPMSCPDMTLKCMNSLGCAVFVGMLSPGMAVAAFGLVGERDRPFDDDLAGLSLEPDLTPPIASL
jgi:hypothetical protein